MLTCVSIVKPTRCNSFLNLILFCSSTLHILDSLSVHHRESKTAHTASVYSVCTVFDSWWWTERPSKTCRVLLQNKI